jgi:hypothetical protein
VVGKVWNSQILAKLPVTSAPTCTGINAKTLGLQHLQLPTMGVSSESPDGIRAVYHWTHALLIQQNFISDGGTTPHAKESTKHFQSLGRILFDISDMKRPGQPFIKGHSQITGCVSPIDWLPEELY